MNKANKEPALELVTEEPKETEAPLQLPDAIQAAIAPLIAPLKAKLEELAAQMLCLVGELSTATEQQAEFNLDKGTIKANFKKYHALTARIIEIGIEQQLIEAETERTQQQLKDTMELTKRAFPITRTVVNIERKLRASLTAKINGVTVNPIETRQLEAERQLVTKSFAELITTLELMGADVTGMQATSNAIIEACMDDSVEKFLPPNAA